MTNEKKIIALLQAATDEYNATRSESASARIKELRQELSALLSAGAAPCPVCHAHPHGMHRRPGVFEVGCLGSCTFKRDGQQHPIRAQGESVEEAVDNWNNGVYWIKP